MNSHLQTRTQDSLPSSLARTLDPHIPSNLMILVFAPLVAIATGTLHLANGVAPVTALINAAGAGAFTGLAWVIGRELDPDHNLTATIAAILTAVALFLVGSPYLLSLAVIVVALRIINRSTGLRPHLTDLLTLVLLSGLAVVLDGFWLIGIVATLAFALNAFLPDADRTNNLTSAVVTLLMTGIISVFVATMSAWDFAMDAPVALAATVIGIGYLTIIVRAPAQLHSVGDYTGELLQRRRVLTGQLLALIVAIAFLLWSGTAGIVALLPVWMAMTGVVMRGLVRRSTQNYP